MYFPDNTLSNDDLPAPDALNITLNRSGLNISVNSFKIDLSASFFVMGSLAGIE
jgi:hypothetical protein